MPCGCAKAVGELTAIVGQEGMNGAAEGDKESVPGRRALQPPQILEIDMHKAEGGGFEHPRAWPFALGLGAGDALAAAPAPDRGLVDPSSNANTPAPANPSAGYRPAVLPIRRNVTRKRASPVSLGYQQRRWNEAPGATY